MSKKTNRDSRITKTNPTNSSWGKGNKSKYGKLTDNEGRLFSGRYFVDRKGNTHKMSKMEYIDSQWNGFFELGFIHNMFTDKIYLTFGKIGWETHIRRIFDNLLRNNNVGEEMYNDFNKYGRSRHHKIDDDYVWNEGFICKSKNRGMVVDLRNKIWESNKSIFYHTNKIYHRNTTQYNPPILMDLEGDEIDIEINNGRWNVIPKNN